MLLDEISIINSRILFFFDLCLKSIKHTHNHFLGNMDIIITGDLYQARFV
jgi:hypothetical protein